MAVVHEAAQPSLLTAAAIKVLRDLASQQQSAAKDIHGGKPHAGEATEAASTQSSALPTGKVIANLQHACLEAITITYHTAACERS